MARPFSLWAALVVILAWLLFVALPVLLPVTGAPEAENLGLLRYWATSMALATLISLLIGVAVEAAVRRWAWPLRVERWMWMGFSLLGLVLFSILNRTLGLAGPWSFLLVICAGVFSFVCAVTGWTAVVAGFRPGGAWAERLLLWLPGTAAIVWAMWGLVGWLGNRFAPG